MDQEMTDPPPHRQQKRNQPSPTIQRVTIKNPEWSYSHLKMIFDPPRDIPDEVDLITWRTMLTNSLMQYLGVVGSAIHIDILHSQDDEVWLRVPSADIVKFGAAVSGFVGTSEGRSVGFKTIGTAAFLMALIGRAREGDVWD